MDLQLDDYKKVKALIRYQMLKNGFEQDSDDAFQDYIVKIIETRTRFQPISFFCTDYIRKYYTGRGERAAAHKNYKETISIYSNKIHDGTEVERKADYKKIMNIIFSISNYKHRRIVLYFFLSGLTANDIAKKEKIKLNIVYRIIYKNLELIRKSLEVKRNISK